MKHNVMVKATALHDVVGRVNYISSPDRQEHLEAVCSTSAADKIFWKSLSDHCQEQAKYSKSKVACEGREFVFIFANELYGLIDPEVLGKMISDKLYEKTGTENTVGVHWNKAHNNYHCHAVVAENKQIETEKGTVLTRNTYYDSEGKRSTKKACTDEHGNLLEGCEFYPKGSIKQPDRKFGAKNREIANKDFLLDLKYELVKMQNELLKEDRFTVFVRDGIHLAEQHVGKNLPAEIQESVRAKNQLVREYNGLVDECWRTSIKLGREENRTVVGMLQKRAKDIRSWSGNWEHWLGALKFSIEKLRKYRRYLEVKLQEKVNELYKPRPMAEWPPKEQPEIASERKPGLDLILDRAEKTRAGERQSGSSRAKNDFGDRNR